MHDQTTILLLFILEANELSGKNAIYFVVRETKIAIMRLQHLLNEMIIFASLSAAFAFYGQRDEASAKLYIDQSTETKLR